MNFWSNKSVAVLGGAAMIGSHLVEQLVALNPKEIWVSDDLSSGKRENISPQVPLYITDLRNTANAEDSVSGADIVFNLACQHGGRGYVDTHRLECLDNLGLTSTIFRACANQGVGKVVFASSACAYPVEYQTDQFKDLKLTEDLIDYRNIKQADGAYGLEKLVGEITLDAYAERGIFEGVACRMFTVYGARVRMNHAIGALIAKSLIKQDPFQVWGNGFQQRNWTFVKDTVNGLILAAENIKRGAVNIGIEDKITVNDACDTIWDILEWRPQSVHYLTDKPVGTLNRVADASKARQLGWKPQYTFHQGLYETIDWFCHNHTTDEISQSLAYLLTER